MEHKVAKLNLNTEDAAASPVGGIRFVPMALGAKVIVSVSAFHHPTQDGQSHTRSQTNRV